MKKSGSFVVLITIIIFVFAIVISQRISKKTISQKSISMKPLILKSSVFESNTLIPAQYTCDGDNVNPPLEISGVDEMVKSFVLIVDDPDASLGTWDHWVVWNISPNTTIIDEGASTFGLVGTGSGGIRSYQGPCPPSGTRRYFFKLYSLDSELNLPNESRKKDVEKAMNGHVLQQAELIGLYRRKI